MSLRKSWIESPRARWAGIALLVLFGSVLLGLRLYAMTKPDLATLPMYMIVQLVTVIVGVVGVALALWVIARALRNEAVETKFGTFPKDQYPLTYRAFIAFYGFCTAVMLIAGASGGFLFLTGQY